MSSAVEYERAIPANNEPRTLILGDREVMRYQRMIKFPVAFLTDGVRAELGRLFDDLPLVGKFDVGRSEIEYTFAGVHGWPISVEAADCLGFQTLPKFGPDVSIAMRSELHNRIKRRLIELGAIDADTRVLWRLE